MTGIRRPRVHPHDSLVRGIAQKVRTQFDLSIDLEDLVGYGYTGLLEAEARFDPSRGVKFRTFAYYRVRGAVVDGVRKMAHLSRRTHEKLKAAAAADALLEISASSAAKVPALGLDRAPTPTERMDDVLGKLTASFLLSAVGQVPEDLTHTSPERALLRAETRTQLNRLVAQLPSREQTLVRGFYFEGRRFDEIAATLGISKSWASRLHTQALARLRVAMQIDQSAKTGTH